MMVIFLKNATVDLRGGDARARWQGRLGRVAAIALLAALALAAGCGTVAKVDRLTGAWTFQPRPAVAEPPPPPPGPAGL